MKTTHTKEQFKNLSKQTNLKSTSGEFSSVDCITHLQPVGANKSFLIFKVFANEGEQTGSRRTSLKKCFAQTVGPSLKYSLNNRINQKYNFRPLQNNNVNSPSSA